ncbi:uncharacterized protein BP01DRAFT_379749 [Aspergillus saccharolyticus JOP 1030-1]|uniref:Uncharacterized protein n=1 Tax=Aspergillus saccharolyticus JOP 1030-1 TaxID=1450539 RepID=A0A319AAB4_9EURO|nr:hypothetical protein BP01DRAFT_379749 [Aspergillus saccharolyticus JOP 1030-1]PYH48568.1 hypothetical protein BP01DRAFT_379749 [Aspergillus saccharolyticus JOP 1030-1]
MANLASIRNEIFKDNDPKRIVIKLHTKTLDPQDYRASASKAIGEVFADWEIDSRILALVIDVWKERTFIVIDVNRQDYDFFTAHKIKAILPVYVVRDRGKSRGWALIRWPVEDEPLALKLMDAHDGNGYNATVPFLQDHTSLAVYASPRRLFDSDGNLSASLA